MLPKKGFTKKGIWPLPKSLVSGSSHVAGQVANLVGDDFFSLTASPVPKVSAKALRLAVMMGRTSKSTRECLFKAGATSSLTPA